LSRKEKIETQQELARNVTGLFRKAFSRFPWNMEASETAFAGAGKQMTRASYFDI
jgi:hypothetical protein